MFELRRYYLSSYFVFFIYLILVSTIFIFLLMIILLFYIFIIKIYPMVYNNFIHIDIHLIVKLAYDKM